MSDEYLSPLREGLKRSMADPAGYRRLNVREPSFWENHGEEIGMFLWVVAVMLACALAWVAVDAAEAVFR